MTLETIPTTLVGDENSKLKYGTLSFDQIQKTASQELELIRCQIRLKTSTEKLGLCFKWILFIDPLSLKILNKHWILPFVSNVIFLLSDQSTRNHRR